MKVAIAQLESISPYSQSKHYETEKLKKESPADYEVRTWRERCHVDTKGFIFIPAMSFKKAVEEAGKFLSMKIPGKEQQTYTKHLEAGVMVLEGLTLPVRKDEVEGEWLFVPANGVSGAGKRVKKCFPLIREWQGEITFFILDETVTQDVFERHLQEAGNFIGIGRWRPRRKGMYGRFVVKKLTWKEAE